MSRLHSKFNARQPLQRLDSGSSATSSIAESKIKQIEEQRSIQARNLLSNSDLLKNQSGFILNACRDVRINVYQSSSVQGTSSGVVETLGDAIKIAPIEKEICHDNKNPVQILGPKNVGTEQKLWPFFTQKRCWFIFILFVVFCTLLSLLILLWLPKKDTVVFVSRAQWDTMGPSRPNELKQISLPVRTLIMSHTNDGGSCSERSECILRVQNLQAQYRHLADIPFNFLIGDNGLVLEGRGFQNQGEMPHKDTTSTFDDSLGLVVAFIGDFTKYEPAASHVKTFNRFLQRSIDRDVLASNYSIFLEDQLVLTLTEPFANGLFRMLQTRNDFYELQEIFSRSRWGAEAATGFELFTDPIKVIAMYQIHPAIYPCTDYDSCATSARSLQQNDLATGGFTDIRYNFLIGPFGIFEGRGWDRKPQNSLADLLESLTIGFFTEYLYTPGELLNTTFSYLVGYGNLIGKISNDYFTSCELQLCRDDL